MKQNIAIQSKSALTTTSILASMRTPIAMMHAAAWTRSQCHRVEIHFSTSEVGDKKNLVLEISFPFFLAEARFGVRENEVRQLKGRRCRRHWEAEENPTT